MATLGQMEAAVKRIVEDRISELDAAIFTHIQRIQRAIEDKCIFRIQYAQVEVQLVPTTFGYAAPTDYIALRETPNYNRTVALADEQDGVAVDRVFLTEVTGTFSHLGNLREQGAPKYWRATTAAGWEFWPRGDTTKGPGAGGAYEVKMPYWKRLDTLENSSDENWFSQNIPEAMEWKAASEVFAEMRDPMAAFWATRSAQRFFEFVREYRRNFWRHRKFGLYPERSLSSRSNHRRAFPRRIKTEIP